MSGKVKGGRLSEMGVALRSRAKTQGEKHLVALFKKHDEPLREVGVGKNPAE